MFSRYIVKRTAKINLSVIHNQQLNPELILKTTLKGQKSLDKNLDSREDMSVGGSNGVRAYEDILFLLFLISKSKMRTETYISRNLFFS